MKTVRYWYGSTPTDEPCAQVGSPDYDVCGYHECEVYVDQLYRFLEKKGYPREKLPQTFKIQVESNAHDLGTYYDVVCFFKEDDLDIDKCHTLAVLLDSESPTTWDEDSLLRLRT